MSSKGTGKGVSAGQGNRKRRAVLWMLCMLLGLGLMAGSVGLVIYNLRTDMDAGEATTGVMEEIAVRTEAAAEAAAAAPPKVLDPYEIFVEEDEKPLKLMEIDGNRYCGVLTIPALNIQLPVMAEWSYPNLRVSPCRYYGSVADENMVIIAHNYSTHFGGIKNLQAGDEVIFANLDGVPFTYTVSASEIVNPYATADVVSGEWPLTLCTCTIGGRTRVVVRCDRVEAA